MVRPERFELPTYCSGGNRSIQLSYGRAPIPTVYMQTATPSIGSLAHSFERRVQLALRLQKKLPAIAASTTLSAASPTSATTTSSALWFRTRFIHVQRTSP